MITLEDCIERCRQGEIAQIPPEEQMAEEKQRSNLSYSSQAHFYPKKPFSANSSGYLVRLIFLVKRQSTFAVHQPCFLKRADISLIG